LGELLSIANVATINILAIFDISWIVAKLLSWLTATFFIKCIADFAFAMDCIVIGLEWLTQMKEKESRLIVVLNKNFEVVEGLETFEIQTEDKLQLISKIKNN
jgi:hypothetical protein